MVEIRYVKLCLNSELKTFSKYKESYELELINVNTTRMKKVKASEIILAMPKRLLELLDQDNFFFKDASHSKVRKLIRKPYECENIYIVGEDIHLIRVDRRSFQNNRKNVTRTYWIRKTRVVR